MDISFTVCNILSVCTVTDFSTEDKASGVKFCMVVHRFPGQRVSHFGELCSHEAAEAPLEAQVLATKPSKFRFRGELYNLIVLSI